MHLDQYKGKNILAWLSFNQNYYGNDNKMCLATPLYVMRNGEYEPIDTSYFPTEGCLAIWLHESGTVDDTINRLGQLVTIRFNCEPNCNTDKKHHFSVNYNPNFGARSDVTISSFNGAGLYQIIDVQQSFEQIKRSRQIVYPDTKIYTNNILLRRSCTLYGPFTCTADDNKYPKYLILDGISGCQYSVAQYNEYEYSRKFLSIYNEFHSETVLLLPRSALPFPDQCRIQEDWISDDNLINSFMEIIRVENNYSREQINRLKDMARTLVRHTSHVQLTDERRSKIKSLIVGVGRLQEASREIARFALGEEHLKNYIVQEAIDKHIDKIKSKLLEFTSIKDSLAALKHEEDELNAKLQQLKKQAAAELATAKNLAKQKTSINSPKTNLDDFIETLGFNDSQKSAVCTLLTKSLTDQEKALTEKALKESKQMTAQIQSLQEQAKEAEEQLQAAKEQAQVAKEQAAQALLLAKEQAKVSASTNTVVAESLADNATAATTTDTTSLAAPTSSANSNNTVTSADSDVSADSTNESKTQVEAQDQDLSNLDNAEEDSEPHTTADINTDMNVNSGEEESGEDVATNADVDQAESDESIEGTKDTENEANVEGGEDKEKVDGETDSDENKSTPSNPFAGFFPSNFAAKAFAHGFHKNASLSLKLDESKALSTILNQLEVNMTPEDIQHVVLSSVNRKLKHSTKLYKAVEKGIVEAFSYGIFREHPLFKAARADPILQEQLTKENEELRTENAKLKEKLASMPDIDTVHEQIKQAKLEYEEVCAKTEQEKKDQEALHNELSATLDKFTDQARQTATLLDSKLVERLLSRLEDTPEQEVPLAFDQELMHTPMNTKDIIKRVGQFMEQAGRPSSFNDIANYLICLTQGFITTFAGEPGTGKTSLCNILAKALGLATNNEQNRFVEIAVERGWTSSKDFIGYYNPLTKTIEKSNEEAFDAFVRLSGECGSQVNPYAPENFAPFIIMLDEANLSPMEHYWAAFLKNCDFNTTAKRELSLGGNCCFSLPEHLRFMATVNFDHTTEELSPRFLDRSWVIMLEPNMIDSDFAEEEDLLNASDMIPFVSLKRAFGVGKDNKIDEIILEKWDRLQEIFRSDKCDLPIMPRNLKMVRNYCAAACKCMKRETPATLLAPLDYAFAQKILPTINGTGESYKNLIEALIAECADMPLSSRHLKRMQRLANNNMGFYQFFAR